ncbi:hypothetical protein L218DRAFT_1008629 [Marasmius fiardii PR-910]|nr:hypothetical protein L218DRAFT_1008629 [Marasmius fiardii PR-910]
MASDKNDTRASLPAEPTVQKSWEAIQNMLDEHDGDMALGYKEDIDTLLVFAGLFSSVVTAFLIESYKWLQQDPSDTTIALLKELVQQGRGEPPSPAQPFVVSSAALRINTFWFLSLTLALVDALFGILCKQWIRELERRTNTNTPEEALALHWLRHQSFKRWKVPAILSSLPILLEIALFLFFAGLLELLYTRHHLPFAFSLVVVGFAGVFYILTTMLPGLSIIYQVLRDHPSVTYGQDLSAHRLWRLPEFALVCPYKSPQSWWMFKLISWICHLPPCKWLVYLFTTTFYRNWTVDKPCTYTPDEIVTKAVLPLSNWALLDLSFIQRFSRIEGGPDLYHWLGFQWLLQETKDNPSMVPHLKNVLGKSPQQHLAMCTSFDKWELNVESASKFSDFVLYNYEWPERDFALTSRILGFRKFVVTCGDEGIGDMDGFKARVADMSEEIWMSICELENPPRWLFIWAFFRPDELLIGKNQPWKEELLEFYKRHWPELEGLDRYLLVVRLARAVKSVISSPAFGSTVLGSRYGGEFLRLVNGAIETDDGMKMWASNVGDTDWEETFKCFEQQCDSEVSVEKEGNQQLHDSGLEDRNEHKLGADRGGEIGGKGAENKV